MNHKNKFQTPQLRYVSKERKKEVEEVFYTLGLMHQDNIPNYSHESEGYDMPFKQFSVLRTTGLTFKTTSNSNAFFGGL